ncbi:nuclease-related domain-containing protein [Propionibacterium sp.]|uniref:nuclease-related domain-containing protein n=1 Tax=Propionibacterium sp. TaxID=1977903 RepID=UPI0039EC2E1F
MNDLASYVPARRALAPSDEPFKEAVRAYSARRAMPNPVSQADWDEFLRGGGISDYAAQRPETGFRGLIYRLLGRNSDSHARRLEEDADELLAQELVRLAALDSRWGFMQLARSSSELTVLQHLVVGPGGVFLLNAKNHPGAKLFVEGDTFLVNGRGRPYVSTSRTQATRATTLLSRDSGFDLGVTGVIVPVKDRRLIIQKAPGDVEVIERAGLSEWLLDRPEELDEHEVITSYAVARQATSWQPRWS